MSICHYQGKFLFKVIILLISNYIINSNHLYSQQSSWTIKGQVLGQTEKALPLATVILVGKDDKEVLKTTADSTGKFVFLYTVKGSYKLVISYIGYKPYSSGVFQLSDIDLGIIKLVSLEQALEEVVIQSKQKLIEVNANTITYNVSKSIDAQGSNALEALRKAPGIYVNPDNTITLNGKGGVSILLDGKQTYLSDKEIADLLKSMPASGIRSIEIINSPTAKYDASGSSGVINIRTNKSQLKGFNGITTTGVSYGVYIRQNQDLSFNYRKNNYNIYGSYNHFIGYYNYIYGSDRIQNGKAYASATDDTDKRKRVGARLGFDYNLNKKSTIGVLLNSNFVLGGGLTHTKTNISQAHSSVIEQVLDAENDYYFQQTDRHNANLNYKYEDGKGRIINIDADYGYFKKANNNLQSNRYSDGLNNTISQNYYRSVNGIKMNLTAFKVDYTTNVWKGAFETGAKYSAIQSDNNAVFFMYWNTRIVWITKEPIHSVSKSSLQQGTSTIKKH